MTADQEKLQEQLSNWKPMCEEWVRCKIREHENQIQLINHRLKPYKKDPPLVFQTAKNIFMALDDDMRREGAETPKGRKEGTLWDAGEATIGQITTPKIDLAQEVANEVAKDALNWPDSKIRISHHQLNE